MNCCQNCFKDKEVIGFILSNTNAIGKCNYCDSEEVPLLDSRELEEFFAPLVSIYKPATELEIIPDKEMKLHEKLQSDWRIFKITSVRTRHRLLKDILSGSFSEDSPLLNEFVEIGALHIADGISDQHEKKWEDFANEIKSSNRYFLNQTVDLALLKSLLSNHKKKYGIGKIFYRARISNKKGLRIEEMGKPPAEKTTSGRANPNGIPYLYVSAQQRTTEYESRATYLDYITVGTFKLEQELSIVSLRETQNISPFILEDNIENYIIHQKYLARLEQELSKPVRRFDKELDYLPTQYLCEYVKSLGYDGIEYGSALHKGGINLAIFDDSKISCKSVEIFEITTMELHSEKIK